VEKEDVAKKMFFGALQGNKFLRALFRWTDVGVDFRAKEVVAQPENCNNG
jgi:hypothetical protein